MSERSLSIRFDDDEYAHLQAMCLLRRISIADAVREAITTHIPGETDVRQMEQARIAEINAAADLLAGLALSHRGSADRPT